MTLFPTPRTTPLNNAMSSLRHLRRPQQTASLKRPLGSMVNNGRECAFSCQQPLPQQERSGFYKSSSNSSSSNGGSRGENQSTTTSKTFMHPSSSSNNKTNSSYPQRHARDMSSAAVAAVRPSSAQQYPAVGGINSTTPLLLYTTADTNISNAQDVLAVVVNNASTQQQPTHGAAHFLPLRRSDSSDRLGASTHSNRHAFSTVAEEDSHSSTTDMEAAVKENSGAAVGVADLEAENSGCGFTPQLCWRQEEEESLLRSLASQPETRLSLLDIHAFGKSPSPAARIAQARFLHREVPIRFARRVLELQNLPYGLSETAPVIEAAGWYAVVVRQLLDCPVPEGTEGEEKFSVFLSSLLRDHTCVPQALSRGVLELEERKEVGVIQRHRIDRILDHFFISRISLRFLVETYISSKKNRPGFSGVIESECSPVLVAWRAAEDVDRLCRVHMGTAPPIEVYGREKDTFTAVPSHLYYIIREVLKNSCRATVQHHGSATKLGQRLPPVKVIVARGKEDMTIKIMDEGGGIRRSDLQHVWSYMYSTAPKPSLAQLRGVPLDHMSGMRLKEEASLLKSPEGTTFAFAGYGMGLPLSRLYARYFGGSLKLRPMEGYGTDAYIHLHRLKTNSEERLPTSLSETLRVMADDGRVHVVKTRSWKTPAKDDSDARELIRSLGVQAE